MYLRVYIVAVKIYLMIVNGPDTAQTQVFTKERCDDWKKGSRDCFDCKQFVCPTQISIVKSLKCFACGYIPSFIFYLSAQNSRVQNVLISPIKVKEIMKINKMLRCSKNT
jgi:flavoprotein